MSFVATAIVGTVVGAGASMYASSQAADASESAAQTQAGAQMQQLNYLKEREAIPQHYREQAMQQLGSVYGLPGLPQEQAAGVPQQAGMAQQAGGGQPVLRETGGKIVGPQLSGLLGNIDPNTMSVSPKNPVVGTAPPVAAPNAQIGMIDRARQSPLYAAIMGGQQAGEEGILRNAAATGGLRSGNVQENLYDYNTQLQNIALLETYNQQLSGLQGFANLPSNAPQIGQTMANIGQTQAAGQLGAAQAQQQGIQGVSDVIGTGIGQYLKYGGI